MGCSRIPSHPDDGMSIAAVFGVEWIFQGLNFLGTELRKLETVVRRQFGENVSCDICSESFWVGQVTLCSDQAHNYCADCLTRTIEGMLLGDLALKYDESTTKPLCCFCVGGVPSTLPIPSPLLERRWDQRIISSELKNLGLPLLKCVHCGYMVIDDEEEIANNNNNNNSNSVPNPPPPKTLSSSIRRRFLTFIGVESDDSTKTPPPRQFYCPQCMWTTCLGCSTTIQFATEVAAHRCKSEDLRLTIEKAVAERLVYTCPRPSCGHTLLKDGGCNHCTCVCGYEYCHLCHEDLGDGKDRWRNHYCQHLTDDSSARDGVRDGKCVICGKCRLYQDRNDEEIRRSIEERMTREWKKKHVWQNVKGWFGF